MRERVYSARERMLTRQGERNSLLGAAAMRRHARLGAGPENFVRLAAKQLGLTGRGYDRILRLARTIADLGGAADITEAHLAEAVAYRPRELTLA